jgi:hypothetical protein
MRKFRRRHEHPDASDATTDSCEHHRRDHDHADHDGTGATDSRTRGERDLGVPPGSMADG